MNITSAFSDYSKSFISAVKEIFPEAKFQADHFHTAKNIWKHLKKSLPEYRREIKSVGEKEKNSELTDPASELWKLSRSLLKKYSNLTQKEREEIEPELFINQFFAANTERHKKLSFEAVFSYSKLISNLSAGD